jgi:integrase
LPDFPAAAQTIALFLSDEAAAGRAYSTLEGRVAALGVMHSRTLRVTNPTSDELVKSVMAGIRRKVGVRPKKKQALTWEMVIEILAHVPKTTLQGKRDRALLLIGFAGAFRRSELVGVHVEHIEHRPEGLVILLPRSKTDQDGEGRTKAIPDGRLRIPEVLQEWLDVSRITSGPVFRRVYPTGLLAPNALTGRAVAMIVKRYAAKAGFDVDDLAGHSLRAGFITSAAEAGAPLEKIMEVSHHTSVETLLGYIRSSKRFKDHAGSKFL